VASGTGTLRAALRHRDFRQLLAGVAISQAGDWLYNVALLVFVYERTHSAGWVAAATFFRLVPYLFGSPLGGVIADTFDRRKVLVGSDLIRAGSMAMLALVAAVDGPVIIALLLAALTTTAGTAYLPAFVATVPELVGEDDLAAANGASSLVENLSVVAGPALGAALLAIGTPALAFGLNALSFVGGALLALTLSPASLTAPAAAASDAPPGEAAGKAKPGFREHFGVGVRALADSRSGRVLALYLVGSNFVYGLQTVIFVLVATRVHTGSEGVGTLYVALGAGGLIVAGLIARMARGARLGIVMFLGLAMCSVPVAALAATHDSTIAFLFIAASGVGMVVVDVLGLTLLQRVMPPDVLGRVWGILDALLMGAIIIGSALVGPVVAALGSNVAFVVLALLAPVLAVLGFRALAEVDRTSVSVLAVLGPIIEAFERLALLHGASRGVIEVLARDAVLEPVDAGTAVVTQGEPANDFYVIKAGRFEVTKSSDDGPVVLAELGPGDYFGEIGILHKVPRTATVSSLEPSELYRLGGQQFLDAVNGAPTMSASLMEGAAVRLAAHDRNS
jgi:MFS family permease